MTNSTETKTKLEMAIFIVTTLFNLSKPAKESHWLVKKKMRANRKTLEHRYGLAQKAKASSQIAETVLRAKSPTLPKGENMNNKKYYKKLDEITRAVPRVKNKIYLQPLIAGFLRGEYPELDIPTSIIIINEWYALPGRNQNGL